MPPKQSSRRTRHPRKLRGINLHQRVNERIIALSSTLETLRNDTVKVTPKKHGGLWKVVIGEPKISRACVERKIYLLGLAHCLLGLSFLEYLFMHIGIHVFYGIKLYFAGNSKRTALGSPIRASWDHCDIMVAYRFCCHVYVGECLMVQSCSEGTHTFWEWFLEHHGQVIMRLFK
jgi:hypothetical protein